MKLIVISAPYAIPGESATIQKMIQAGIDRVHLRKPECTLDEMRELLGSIPVDLYSRISIHDHFSLVKEFDVGGVHLNRRNPHIPQGFSGIVSRSVHTVEESASSSADYTFLSPVFDSISKVGYRSAFSNEDLLLAAQCGKIGKSTIALGGVTPAHLPVLAEFGFGGAAFLGYVWNGDSPQDYMNNVIDIIDAWKNCNS